MAAYEAGNIARALEGLAQIEREKPAADDRMLYLRGKAYEAPGETRNIKNSISAYTALTRNFPESPYYSEANKRIAYLNKYYFNIR
jgi:outer membrane protein assembly factor BamD (BamD/ComL family)